MPVTIHPRAQRCFGLLPVLGVLVLASIVSLAMLGFRVRYTAQMGYLSLVWDLFLAWVPLAFALGLIAVRWRRGVASMLPISLALGWILFLPNAPYLLTQFIHLDPEHGPSIAPLRAPYRWIAAGAPVLEVPAWFDAIMLCAFALTGLMLGFVALRVVQRRLDDVIGAGWSWATVIVVLGLSSFGVTLGRFQRFNSWDLFQQPIALLSDVARRVIFPHAHPRTTAATLGLAAILLLSYIALPLMARLFSEGRPRAVVSRG